MTPSWAFIPVSSAGLVVGLRRCRVCSLRGGGALYVGGGTLCGASRVGKGMEAGKHPHGSNKYQCSHVEGPGPSHSLPVAVSVSQGSV